MALEGDLRTFSLPDILQVVSQQQKTGILTVQGEQDILAVSFLNGEIVAADALNQNFEDGLGEVLASQGVLRPDEFGRLVDEHKSSGERFSEFLLRRGVLTEATLLQALRVQTYRLLLQVLRWRDGDFKFYSGDEVSYEEGMTPISVEEVLLRSVGDLVGEGTMSGTLPHGFVAYEALAPSRPVRVGTRDLETSRQSDEIWISPDEKIIFGTLDGRTTAADLARETGLGEYKTLYALFRLIQLGLARPAGGAAGADAGSDTKPGLEAVEPPAPPVPEAAAEEAPPEAASPWASREERLARAIAAVALALGLVAASAAVWRPAALLLPLASLEEERAALEKQRRVGRYLAIDRAARTFYLLEGRYPETLDSLTARGLLASRSLRGPSGAPIEYLPAGESYQLRSRARDGRAEGAGVTESVVGDFFLDPEVFAGLQEEVGVPLVLLD